MSPIEIVPDLIQLIEREGKSPHALNERAPHEASQAWIHLSHGEMVKQIRALALFLHSLQLKEQEAIAILAQPGIAWTVADLASLCQGFVTVPMFGNLSHENFIFELSQPQIKTLFVSGKEEWELCLRHEELIERIIALDDLTPTTKAIPLSQALLEGEKIDKNDPTLFASLCKKVTSPKQLATIVYTSGTTGLPKGVMLSHENLVSNNHLNPLGWFKEKDTYLSVLPLAHIFGRSLNYLMLHALIPVYYFNDHKNLGQACQEVSPTVSAVVPRLLEKIYAKMSLSIEEAPILRRIIGKWAFNLAKKRESLYTRIFHPLADLLVYKKLRKKLGGAFRIIISGGAPLNPSLGRFFNRVGIPIYEGYGLTEASIVAVNRPEKNKIGTVGKIIEILDVSISDEGEVLIKGPIVFQGYFLNPRASRDALDYEGWLHTGDKGILDSEGFLTIIGRTKELIKSSIGEYIAPAFLEQLLAKAPIVEMALIVAERRKFVSALLFPNFDVIHKWKKLQHQEQMSDKEFLEGSYIKKWMDNFLEEINRHLNHWEEIHGYRFVLTPPTVHGGELTPSMKLRRDYIQSKYKELIDSIYPKESHV